jgi:hypothetical protein
MSLALDPTLQAAQDGISHRPIIEVISSGAVDDIPFDGVRLTAEATNESKPNVIMHSSGRICKVYTFGTAAFKYLYTDASRTEFHWVDISLPANYSADEAALCELAGGNIGIILHCTYSGNEKLRSLVLTPEGETVTAQAEIATWSTAAHVISSPFIIRLSSNSYFLVYADKTVSGPTYYIRKRTSSDFSTWSAEGTCSIGGLTASKRIQNPHLLQIATGEIWCWFDYLESTSGNNELVNVYYSTSADNGSTWANAANFTNFSTYDTVGLHPVAAQKVANQIHAIYTEQSGALHMNKTDTGYCGEDEIRVSGLHFDSIARKIYCACNPGTIGISCVLRIDIDTWVIDACWNTLGHSIPSVPAFNSIWKSSLYVALDRCHSNGHYVGIVGDDYSGKHYAAILDSEADTITQFNFQDNPTYGLTKNIDPPTCANGTRKLVKCYLDADAKRLYLLFLSYSYGNQGLFYIGYIDMTEVGPSYTLHEVVNEPASLNDYLAQLGGTSTVYPSAGDFQVFPSTNEIIISFGYKATNGGTMLDIYAGELRIYTAGILTKTINYSNNSAFPMHGLGHFAYKNNKIYGTFYSNLYPPGTIESGKSGLCIIDLTTDVITFSIPTYATFPTIITYIQNVFIADSHRLLVCAKNMGVPASQSEDMMGMAVFDMVTLTWTRFNNSNVPGMDRSGHPNGYLYSVVAYDSASEMIITGESGSVSYYDIIAFNINGLLHQPVYRVGTYSSGMWSWTDAIPLVQGYNQSQCVVALENANRTIFAFWVETDLQQASIKWDKEGSSLNLSSYLTRGREHVRESSIDGAPAPFSFAVKDGHLFDPHNSNSLLSIYLRKGRKITLRLGEKIGGTDYWQNQGTFFVKDLSIEYERGTYPEMQVTAEDERQFWDEQDVDVSEHYNGDNPKAVLEDLLSTHAGKGMEDMDVPVFDTAAPVYRQWVEMNLKKILDQLAEHFGYFMRMDVDGKVTFKKISELNPVDHIYADLGKILKFSPDLSYSSNINRVIVIGESREFLDCLFGEEPIRSYNGTVGWWGGKKDIDVWYSDDHSRRCRYPRLEVIQSVKSFNFKLGGGGESITSIRDDDLGCIITISTPNMVPVVVALIAAIAGLAAIAYSCDSYLYKPGWCGPTMVMLLFLLQVLLNIICSVAAYNYQVHARPFGKVGQTIQSIPPYDDTAHQAETGRVIPTVINDSLCNTIGACNQVAAFEGMVVRLQRSRVKLYKIAHLQEEEGDILQILHPITGASMKILVAKLVRKIGIPSGEEEDLGVVDEIEGWRIA